MAGKPVRLTPGAREELLRAVDFYDEQASLGPDLYTEIQACLARIAEASKSYPFEPGLESDGTRFAATRRFRYRVVFLEDPDVLRILAIRHVRQKPGYWHSRLDEL